MLSAAYNHLGDSWKSVREAPTSRISCFTPGFSGSPNGVVVPQTRISSDHVHRPAVIQQVEAISRFVLRLAIQLDLKFPNVARCCQTHRQSPHLSSFTSTPEVRVLSSASVTRPQWSYNPLRLPDWPLPLPTTLGGATSTSPGYPPLARITLLCMPCSLPRWTGTGACWFLPCPRGLLRSSGGPASPSSLSRPAHAVLTLPPAPFL